MQAWTSRWLVVVLWAEAAVKQPQAQAGVSQQALLESRRWPGWALPASLLQSMGLAAVQQGASRSALEARREFPESCIVSRPGV